MKVITLTRLVKLGACPFARRLFKRTFGKSARITPGNLVKAEEAGLTVEWLAAKLGLIPSHEDFDEYGRCKACRATEKTKVSDITRARRALLRVAARG